MKVIFVLVVAGLLGALVLWFHNPLNWGTTRSERFSISKFESIHAGESIEAVVSKLGAPLGIGDWPDCEKPPCKNYVFAGDPVAPWVLGYRKAWVLVGSNGEVIRTHWYTEP